MKYGIAITTRLDFATAVERTRASLADQGVGVLTEINVHATLKKKLDVDVEPQIILGACRPALAEQALRTEPDIGLLLPCNVVVRREADRTLVSALDPRLMVAVTDNPELEPVAEDAAVRLRAALNGVAAI